MRLYRLPLTARIPISPSLFLITSTQSSITSLITGNSINNHHRKHFFLPGVAAESDGHRVKVDDEAPLAVCRYDAGGDVLTSRQGEDVDRGLGGNLRGLVPHLQEGVNIIVDAEHHPVPVALHQLGQGTRLLLVIWQPLEESILVDLADKERWTKWHGTNKVTKLKTRPMRRSSRAWSMRSTWRRRSYH